MRRGLDDRNILDEFVLDFVRVLEPHAYMIVSGYLAISHGRATEDIDLILERLDEAAFSTLHRALVAAGFTCMQGEDPHELYTDYLSRSTAVRYTRTGEFLPEMEVKFAKDALDEEQLQQRVKLPLTGLDVWFAPVEAGIAFKEAYLGTPKDQEDARRLRLIYQDELDEEEIERWKRRLTQR